MRIPTDENFGAMVREYRELRKWSMSELASKLRDAGLTNFHPTTISRMERGERAAKLGEASVIAQVFQVPLDDLVDIPMEPWEVDKSELEEYGERIETYARWSAYWGVCLDEDTEETLTMALNLEQKIANSEVPDSDIENCQQLIDKLRGLTEQNRTAFWREHILALTSEEREEFYREYLRR